MMEMSPINAVQYGRPQPHVAVKYLKWGIEFLVLFILIKFK